MPKIISLASLGDTLYVLYDSGFIFASSGEKSWYRVTLPRPYQIEEAEKLAAPTPEPVTPQPIRPEWNTWLAGIHRKTDWFVLCPRCKCNIQSTDTSSLRDHWLQGHFDATLGAGE